MSSIFINYDQHQAKEHYLNGNRPVTLGSKENDVFALNSKTRGLYHGGKGDDTFDYGKEIGKLDTIIRGGNGNDTLAFSKLKAGKAMKALKKQNYSFVQLDKGFALRTNDGEEIKVFNIENIAFANKTYNLTNDDDLKAFVQGLKKNGVNIIDETGKDRNRNNSPTVRFAFNNNPYQHSHGNHLNHSHPYSYPHNHHAPANNAFDYGLNQGYGNAFPSNISYMSPEQAYMLGAQQANQFPFSNNFGNSIFGNPTSLTNPFQNAYGQNLNNSFNPFGFNNPGFYPNTMPAGSYGYPSYGFNQSPFMNYGNPFFQNPMTSYQNYGYGNPFGANAIRVPASAMLAHTGSGFESGLTNTSFNGNHVYDFSNSTNNFNFYLNSPRRTYSNSDYVVPNYNDYTTDYTPVTTTPTYRTTSYRPISINNVATASSVSNGRNSRSNASAISISSLG